MAGRACFKYRRERERKTQSEREGERFLKEKPELQNSRFPHLNMFTNGVISPFCVARSSMMMITENCPCRSDQGGPCHHLHLRHHHGRKIAKM